MVLIISAFQANAQTEDTFSEQDLLPTSLVEPTNADSLEIANLKDSLAAVHLSEANTKMELELLRFRIMSADSIKREELRQRVDSLRASTKGVPVVVEEDTLYYLYSKCEGYSPQQRALMTQGVIEKLGKKFSLQPDSVYIDHSETIYTILYDGEVIATFTELDAIWAGLPQDSLTMVNRTIIVKELAKLKAEHSIWVTVKRIILLLLIVVGQILLFKLTKWLFRKLRNKIEKMKDTKLKPIMVHNYELLDTQRQVNLIIFFSNICRWIVVFLQLLISVPLIFAIFPQTKKLTNTILGYIWSPVKSILDGIVDYIPNLFTIFIIWLCIRYLIKLLRYLSSEVNTERLKIPGFYPDWALPTFNIIRFLLYAFMIAMIYPYLPGSDKGVFQGISVFVGLIISLGSSTVIGNIIAGLVITYMRPFSKGDRIKLDDTVGDIIEKTPLVTRIRTSKNEIVTVPNSFIMSTKSINYTTSSRTYGLILHAEVTIGYDVPWRVVHQLLIDAALKTDGILYDPHPFVLETGLNDWYPVYQINAYTREPYRMGLIYSELFQNIQDCFNEAGVEIMSPTYIATRDGNASTVVDDPNPPIRKK
ncbi:MAG: mechanosensitive ion channel family protein [Muribaculaceae bacterium]|nr:mechanosensitive ion channel family protein [Muribaculaceae bacterium]